MTNPTPDFDETPHYKPGDKFRPNPDGSVTLLRPTADYRRHKAVVTWKLKEMPEPAKRAYETQKETA